RVIVMEPTIARYFPGPAGAMRISIIWRKVAGSAHGPPATIAPWKEDKTGRFGESCWHPLPRWHRRRPSPTATTTTLVVLGRRAHLDRLTDKPSCVCERHSRRGSRVALGKVLCVQVKGCINNLKPILAAWAIGQNSPQLAKAGQLELLVVIV